MERLNDHRHVHNLCARARGYVHEFDFCYDWVMATKACEFTSVRRSLNLERLPGNKSSTRSHRQAPLICLYTGVLDTVGNRKFCRQTH